MEIVFSIPKGASSQFIGEKLESRRVIRSASAFRYYVKLKGLSSAFKAGTFTLDAHLSMIDNIQTLMTENGQADFVKVTIPEGFSINDIADRLESLGIVSANAFSTYAHVKAKADFAEKYPYLNSFNYTTLEGYLFPETYFISQGATPYQIVSIMLKEFDRRITPLWEAAEAPKGSPKQRFNFHQVLTIASLIEKEARIRSEMTTISSVFYNRLKKRMQLASDPTVVYALGKQYKKKVFYKDLKVDSPYNTYKYTGFPPTPIASIGDHAFKASLDPLSTPYYFFVANRDGSHHFTRTYQEHLNYQRKNKK